MTKMIVVCAGDKDTRFDRDHYSTKHVELCMECWGRYGLQAVDTFYPAGEGDGWVSIGVHRFRERSDIDAALAAPETKRVMADVEAFTDTKDIRRCIVSAL